MLSLAISSIQIPNYPPGYTHPKIRNNPKLFPFFKDCIGAVDGTHIRAKVPVSI